MTKILILVPKTFANYEDLVSKTQNFIVSYFGYKFAKASEKIPSIVVSAPINEDDVKHTYANIYKGIELCLIENAENATGCFIRLSNK